MFVAALLTLVLSPDAHAQDARLASRLPAALAEDVQRVVHTAAARGLPAEPLVQKALEGHAKGAAPDIIVAAVEALATRLDAARAALGEHSGREELEAGAAALYVGFDASLLSEMRTRRKEASVAAPLMTAVFFAQYGLSRERSHAVLLSLLQSEGPLEDRLLWLQRTVREDVARGVSAADAVDAGVRALIGGAR